MTPEEQPATKQDITDVRQEITEVRQEIKAAESRLRQEIADSKAQVIEAMRDMQSEILRGLEGFARGNFARLHTLDRRTTTNEGILQDTNERITALEERVLMLEVRRPPTP